MKLYRCTSSPSDKRYCFVSKDVSPYCNELYGGEPVQPVLDDEGLTTVDLNIDETKGGLDLPDLVGCGGLVGYLILRKTLVEALQEQFSLGACEVLPARLINKKKRIHSDEYFVINPLGKVDCLDKANSDMNKKGNCVQPFGKFFIKGADVPADRDIFRVRALIGYIFSERLVDYIREQNLTNCRFEDVMVS